MSGASAALWSRYLMLALAAACFALSLPQLDRVHKPTPDPEMEIALPKFAQLILAVGDPYLAANFGSIRALVSDTQRMDRESFHILAQVQKDVAWLNPAHEDNYYTAAAILPWNGEVGAAQDVLRRAVNARPFDAWPAFYYAFNLYYFKHDAVSAAQWLRASAARTNDESENLALNDIAARWIRNSADRKTAIAMLTAMAKAARSGGFAAYLRKHVVRLQNQQMIEDAVRIYKERKGMAPNSLDDLLREALLERAQLQDPFGATYRIDDKGMVIVQGSVK